MSGINPFHRVVLEYNRVVFQEFVPCMKAWLWNDPNIVNTTLSWRQKF